MARNDPYAKFPQFLIFPRTGRKQTRAWYLGRFSSSLPRCESSCRCHRSHCAETVRMSASHNQTDRHDAGGGCRTCDLDSRVACTGFSQILQQKQNKALSWVRIAANLHCPWYFKHNDLALILRISNYIVRDLLLINDTTSPTCWANPNFRNKRPKSGKEQWSEARE